MFYLKSKRNTAPHECDWIECFEVNLFWLISDVTSSSSVHSSTLTAVSLTLSNWGDVDLVDVFNFCCRIFQKLNFVKVLWCWWSKFVRTEKIYALTSEMKSLTVEHVSLLHGVVISHRIDGERFHSPLCGHQEFPIKIVIASININIQSKCRLS